MPAIRQNTNTQSSKSGQTLPFPELNKQLGTSLVNSLTGYLDNLNSSTTPGGGAGSDFQGYMDNIGGPPANFTDIDVRGVYTPQQQHEGIQAAFANATAMGEGQNQQLQRTFGMGMGSDSGFLQELLQGNKGRYAAIGADQARKWDQNASGMNAQQRLASAGAQTNVESLRAGDDQNSRQLALTGRGQDFDRERNLLSLLAGGLGGAGGLLGPLTNSQSSSSSGNAVYANKYSSRGITPRTFDYEVNL